jgi:hypothetical protein
MSDSTLSGYVIATTALALFGGSMLYSLVEEVKKCRLEYD